MNFSAITADERVLDVHFTDDALRVSLRDGRVISVPLVWYPRLLNATPAQRKNWKIAGGGYGIHWPEIRRRPEQGVSGHRASEGRAGDARKTATTTSGQVWYMSPARTTPSQSDLKNWESQRMVTILTTTPARCSLKGLSSCSPDSWPSFRFCQHKP